MLPSPFRPPFAIASPDHAVHRRRSGHLVAALLSGLTLSMGTALATPRGKDLYAYWGDTVADYLNQRLAGERSPLIANLASVEYARVALRKTLAARVVDCQFEEWKGGGYKIISFFAKQARGLMARYAIEHRVRRPEQLQGFSAAGYALAREVSTPERLVFRRRA